MSPPLTQQGLAVAEPTLEPGPPAPTVRQIFDEHAAYIWRTLRHLGVAEADVPDLCQDVFVTVHRKLPEFEGRAKLRTWLYGICIRIASDHRRRAYVRRERATADPALDQADPATAPDGQADARSRLLRLLDVLDEEKRAVLVLYEIEGLTMKEVAEAVSCPLQTAYSRLHAARRRLLELTQRESKP